MDLVIGLVAVLLLSAALFVVGRKIALRNGRMLVLLAVSATLLHLILFISLLWDNLLLARLLPWSNLIVVGNLQPALVGLLAGLASGLATIPPWRRALLVTTIATISLWKSYAPLWRSVPAMDGNHWADAVCLQSTESTCSPAAAATLLKAHGIETTEAEMARLCLTSDHGTTMHGLYRGLKLKTENTPWRIHVFRGSGPDLRSIGAQPVLLTVGLRHGQAASVDPRYATLWGWPEGLKHTVVLFEFAENGEAIIGDPMIGRETWSSDGIDVLWQREGIQLVRRE